MYTHLEELKKEAYITNIKHIEYMKKDIKVYSAIMYKNHIFHILTDLDGNILGYEFNNIPYSSLQALKAEIENLEKSNVKEDFER